MEKNSQSNFEKIHNCLEKQFGLVGPMNDPADRTSKDKLVFEDSEGIGRYRVDFINEEDSGIYFRYWAQRLNSNIIEDNNDCDHYEFIVNNDVRSIKAKQFLKSHRIEETYLAFNQLPSEDTVESLYNSGNEDVKSIIKQNCAEVYYIPSIQGREERTREPKLVAKKSFTHVLITDRDADITSNSWRQKVFIFFNETYDIICAWKIDITNKVPAEVYTPLKG